MRRRGDDLPDVLAQWAQALWDASEVVPVHRRAELLSRAADRAASSVRLQKVAVPEATCLLGDILIALGEHVWSARSTQPDELGVGEDVALEGAAARTARAGAAARTALWHCRRALHEGYAEATRVRGRDVSILCAMADALLDCGRLQRDMLTCGVDLTLAQPAAIADASEASGATAPSQPPVRAPSTSANAEPAPPPPLPPPAPPLPGAPTTPSLAEAEAEAEAELAGALDDMQVDVPAPLVMEAEPPVSLPPLLSATECLERAASLYRDVLEAPAAEWAAARVSRLDTMYNAACACALHGGREEDCARLLGALAAEGALQRAELERDVDLAPHMSTPWMQSLLRGVSA